jgi:hypothetical protein
MPLNLTIQRGPQILLVEGTGEARLADLLGVIDLIAQVTQREGTSRAIANLLACETRLAFTDHLQMGMHAYSRLQHLQRGAAVVRASARRDTTERVARKLGLRVRVFTALDDALQWVGETSPLPAGR